MKSDRGETKRRRAPVILIVVVVLFGITTQIARIKQWMLPAYATPERFEELFVNQLAALRAVAEGEKDKEQVAALFADPAIESADVVNDYGEDVAIIDKIKPDSDEQDRAEERGIMWPMEAGVGSPVVNIWGGSVAVYEVKFETKSGKVRGYRLAVGLAYLESQAKG